MGDEPEHERRQQGVVDRGQRHRSNCGPRRHRRDTGEHADHREDQAAAEAGALVGFVTGLGYDLFLASPVGMCALAYALTAYIVGVLQTGMLRSPGWIPPLIGFLAGLGGGLIFTVIGYLAGVAAVSTWSALTTVVLAAVYDALLAPFVFWLVAHVIDREPAAASGRSL